MFKNGHPCTLLVASDTIIISRPDKGFYEAFKPIFAQLTPSEFLNFLLAGVVAGAVASIVLCPAEDARIRMVSNPDFADGLISALTRLIKEGGFASVFAGLASSLYKIMGKAGTDVDDTSKFRITFGAAAITSLLSCITSQPGDFILTETYKSHGSTTFSGIIKGTYSERGIKGFFGGLKARIIHCAGIITSQLIIYDQIKIGLGLAATGSH